MYKLILTKVVFLQLYFLSVCLSVWETTNLLTDADGSTDTFSSAGVATGADSIYLINFF